MQLKAKKCYLDFNIIYYSFKKKKKGPHKILSPSNASLYV